MAGLIEGRRLRQFRRKVYPVAPNAHPLVREFFAILQRDRTPVMDVADRAGVDRSTMLGWRTGHSPSLVTIEAALNAVGYEIVIQERDE